MGCSLAGADLVTAVPEQNWLVRLYSAKSRSSGTRSFFCGSQALLNGCREPHRPRRVNCSLVTLPVDKVLVHERNHQGKENLLLFPASDQLPQSERKVCSRERLGGLLLFYHREAA